MSETDKTEFTEFSGFFKPEEIPPLEKFKQFLYNEKDGTYIGRTPLSWGE